MDGVAVHLDGVVPPVDGRHPLDQDPLPVTGITEGDDIPRRRPGSGAPRPADDDQPVAGEEVGGHRPTDHLHPVDRPTERDDGQPDGGGDGDRPDGTGPASR
jgi:hypothetical protein